MFNDYIVETVFFKRNGVRMSPLYVYDPFVAFDNTECLWKVAAHHFHSRR